jgi:H+/Cl- antiporter ClcA
VTPSSHTRNDGQRASSLTRLSAVTVLTGVGAGIAGMALARLLHAVQHVAYGYSRHELMGPESFFDGVSAASPVRRVAVLVVCSMVAGCGWYLLYRFARPLVSIEKAIASDRPRLPGLATTIHAMLQIVTVALGSPLGREVAPASSARRMRVGLPSARG